MARIACTPNLGGSPDGGSPDGSSPDRTERDLSLITGLVFDRSSLFVFLLDFFSMFLSSFSLSERGICHSFISWCRFDQFVSIT